MGCGWLEDERNLTLSSMSWERNFKGRQISIQPSEALTRSIATKNKGVNAPFTTWKRSLSYVRRAVLEAVKQCKSREKKNSSPSLRATVCSVSSRPLGTIAELATISHQDIPPKCIWKKRVFYLQLPFQCTRHFFLLLWMLNNNNPTFYMEESYSLGGKKHAKSSSDACDYYYCY